MDEYVAAEQCVRIVKETMPDSSIEDQIRAVEDFCAALGVYLLGEHDYFW